MVIMFTNDGINLYIGDMVQGDREATTEEIALYEANRLATQQSLQAKEAYDIAINSITVTTTLGKVFDGRDKDQVRMLSAIQASTLLGLTESAWKLHDNTVVSVTIDELKEAHALSIQALGAIIIGGVQ